jgi:excisionase family DNA binding protein
VEKRFLEECLAKGLSLEAIGKLAGKHPSTVSYWLHKFGLQARGARQRRPKSGLTRGELEPLVEENLTIEEIARRLGVGDTTTRNWLRRHGLRTQGSRRRAALASMRRTGESETELECRRHGVTRHVAVTSGLVSAAPNVDPKQYRGDAARSRRSLSEKRAVDASCVAMGAIRQHSSFIMSIPARSRLASAFEESRARLTGFERRRQSASCCVRIATPRSRPA